MQRLIVATALVLTAFSIGGCSYIDRLTGSTDNTVLPGTREDAIPGKTQFPDASDTATIEQPGSQSAQTGAETVPEPVPEPACKAGDPDCKPVDGTFSDPQ